MTQRPPTCIDLFCGCGGFSLGMMRAGFHVLAAIDLDAVAIETIRTNLAECRNPTLAPLENPLERNLQTFHPSQLGELIGTDHVDVIVGGPPCQGFSTARQVDGANHGARLKADPRRHLYRAFLRYVDYFQPSVFVMENVLGLRTAAGGEYFTRVQKEARELGYRVHGQIENAWELGVPQKRRRQLIVGVRNDLSGYFSPELSPVPRALRRPVLGMAIGDLPALRAGEGRNEREYDLVRRAAFLRNSGDGSRRFLSKVLEVGYAEKLTNHVARPHSERDLRDFTRLREGENSATAMRDRGVVFEFPYDKSKFKDRYTRQSRSHPCSTVVAHLSKDGLMFIHPTQNRSLTPREAARAQSFPDWFRFPDARTHSFRLIGNAVPPLISEAVGLETKRLLQEVHAPLVLRTELDRRRGKAHGASPNKDALKSKVGAARRLQRLAELDRRALRALTLEEIRMGWHALLYLFPGLHPDNALDHGNAIDTVPAHQVAALGFGELLSRRYARSGWPVALELVGREVWRRYESAELSDEDFYCVEAQRAGLTAGLQSNSLR